MPIRAVVSVQDRGLVDALSAYSGRKDDRGGFGVGVCSVVAGGAFADRGGACPRSANVSLEGPVMAVRD
jgi:hypothetical protein